MEKYEHNSLDKKILEMYSAITSKPIMLDGIINEKEYSKANIKVLWILKEPFGDTPVHLREGIPERISGFKKDSPLTLKRIALTSFMIINKIKNIQKEPNWDEYGKSLNQIAIINLKKFSGKSTTNMVELNKFYNNNKPIIPSVIFTQLNEINPDIIIGGNTLDILKPDMSKHVELKYGHFKVGKILCLNADHPGQRNNSTLSYCNKICERILEFQ